MSANKKLNYTDGDVDQEMQQGHLCISKDPRRVGGPGGEPTIIKIEVMIETGFWSNL